MRQALLVLFVLLITIACAQDSANNDESQTRPPVTGQRIINANEEPGNWLSHGRTYNEQRFSPLNSINADTVADLGLAWHYDIDTNRGMQTTPLVADGVMYLTAAWSVVYALDAVSGKLLWKHDPQVPKSWGAYACCDVVNRGAALWGDKVYVATIDGYLVALNAQTGKVIWKRDTINRQPPYTITGAPRVVKGKVIIGNGGADYGVRGYVTAYDAETGEQVWRFYTVPGNPANGFESEVMKMAAKTWNGQWWKYGGGGTAWDSFAYDPELDLLYIGTGNGSPWNREIRSPGGGDNLFLASIIALRPDTGEYVWHYQTTPGETWDYTAVQHMILADLNIDGSIRKVLMQAPKNGFFYVLDRQSGKVISAEPYVPLNWASHVDLETGRPVEIPGARYEESHTVIYPNTWGGHSWHPMSFSPITGLVYLPMIGGPEALASPKKFTYHQDHINTGIDYFKIYSITSDEMAKHPAIKVRIAAWDPVLRKEVFRIDSDSGYNAGILSTAGNLLFQGEANGEFAAYKADTGDKLWGSKANTAITASPITFQVDGEQYVTIVGGWGIYMGFFEGDPETRNDVDGIGRVLTYKIGGTGKLPDVSMTKRTVGDLPKITATANDLAQGRALFAERCSWCHGVNAVGTGSVPDLRYTKKETHSSWNAIVLDGAYFSKGMPKFGEVLTKDQAKKIQAFVVDQSRQLRNTELSRERQTKTN